VSFFVAVLPISQLVPIFTWVETLRLPPVDHALKRLGLEIDASADVDNSLKGFIESKLRSHAGFFVEAFIEAIPQAVLTTAFIVQRGRGSSVAVLSVVISIVTIASKTYLLSYAVDGVTFAFNFLCTVGDCFGLFATVSILALHGFSATLAPTMIVVLASAASSMLLLIFFACVHDIMDEHLIARNAGEWRRQCPHKARDKSQVFFELYVKNFLMVILLPVPCAALIASVRLSILSWLTRVYFAQVADGDPQHLQFFRSLFRFMRGGGRKERQARVSLVNFYFARAKTYEKELRLRNRGEELHAIRNWAERYALPVEPLAGFERDFGLAEVDEHRRIKCAGGACRRLAKWLWGRCVFAWNDFTKCEETLRPGRNNRKALAAEFRARPTSALLWAVAWITLVPMLSFLVLLVLTIVVLLPLGLLFPLLHVASSCTALSAGDDSAALSCVLTSSYLAVLAAVVALMPVVICRQALWLRLTWPRMGARMKVNFFREEFVAEIQRLHGLPSLLHPRLGQNLTWHVLGFLTEKTGNVSTSRPAPELIGLPRQAWQVG
jgi:hypothetical protein